MTLRFRPFRQAFRSLSKRPGFACLAIGTVGLGIGASTAVFSIVYGALGRPLPYRDPDALMLVRESCDGSKIDRTVASVENFEDWTRQARSFSGLAASQAVVVSVRAGAEAVPVPGARVTVGLLRVLGRRPLLGRDFLPQEGEPGRNDVVLLGHGFWLRHFGGDPGVVGRAVGVDGRQAVVAGILPPDLRYPAPETDIWVPFVPLTPERNRAAHLLRVVGRLAPGVTREQATAEFVSISDRLAKLHPDSNNGWRVVVDPLAEAVVGKARRPLVWLQAAALLVLLIGCVNVANLFLVRAIERRPELEVLSALGAGRRALVARLLGENLLASAVGGLLGVAVAAGGLALAKGLGPERIPRVDEAALDFPALAFAGVLCLFTAAATGVLPALRAAAAAGRSASAGSRHTAGARATRTLDALVVVEVALALALLAGAGLVLRSVALARRVPPGFEPGGVQTVGVGLPVGRLSDPSVHGQQYLRALERLRAIPTLRSVAVGGRVPLANWTANTTFLPQGRFYAPGSEPDASYGAVSPGFFETLSIPLRTGRDFTLRDDASAPFVAIVSEKFARLFWPGQEAVGRTVQIAGDAEREVPIFRRVVGVVGDVRLKGLDVEPGPVIYVPLGQNTFPAYLRRAAVFFRGEPGSASEVRRALAAYDREMGLAPALEMERVISDSLAPRRLLLTPLLAFAAISLALSAVGVGGVLAYSVAQRRREFGLRIALGSTAAGLVLLVARRAAGLLGLGAAAGLAIAFGLSRSLSGALFGVTPFEPPVYLAVLLLLAVSGAAAAAVPVWRAARLDPVAALAGA